jgi:predicted SprT family Zn-dependent metalloprotease
MLAEIMVHEIAHQVDYNLNGVPAGNRWHGKTWQDIMLNYGVEPNTYHDMEL